MCETPWLPQDGGSRVGWREQGQGEVVGCKLGSAPGLGVFKVSRAALLQANICGHRDQPCTVQAWIVHLCFLGKLITARKKSHSSQQAPPCSRQVPCTGTGGFRRLSDVSDSNFSSVTSSPPAPSLSYPQLKLLFQRFSPTKLSHPVPSLSAHGAS